ncbi:NUDIX domain-containing protein [Virgibacillus soli]|uniref:NUDIX domain-containing protein n=1 Tax=Paracerasibacillus soli TaxID=480284 RepID=A0ABU5CQ05_9BACI|nr:NUDIX domain-containing protein [Virgibacillus soli]MDY0407545.1 NUDIX domain-containing protein [Virgibacillus soli]
MFYRKKTYHITPEMLDRFNQFFHRYLYPNQIKHGAKLIGRWVNEEQSEITAIWKYTSRNQYEQIENKIRQSDIHQQAQQERKRIEPIYISSREEFITSTAPYPATYHHPQQIVSTAVFVTNDSGEVLLVRNAHRSDTMEIPGGQVEEGESIVDAARREVLEETGVSVKLTNVTGIYQNKVSGIVCVVFRGKYVSGELRTAAGETIDVCFQKLTKENARHFIKREHFLNRTLDAMDETGIACEIFNVRPYELLERLEADFI